VNTHKNVAVVYLVALLLGAGCGNSKAVAGKAAAPPGKAAAPDKAPGKAPAAAAPAAAAPAAAAPAAPGAQLPLGAGWDAPKGAEHPVFRLADNRLLAHVQRKGGLVVPAGEPGFGKYTLSRASASWQMGVNEGGKKAAVITRQARLEVPLAVGQQEGARLFVRASVAAPAKLGAKVNGQEGGLVQLNPGWQTATIEVPAGAFVAGENTIEFVPRSRVAIQWIAVGKEAPEDDLAPVHDGKGGLVIPVGGALAWYVSVTRPGMAFAAQAAAQGTCSVHVRVFPGAGGPIDRTGGAGGVRLDLTSLKGQIARLEIAAEGQGCQSLTLTDGALTLPGEMPKVQYTKRPKHIFFWLGDSFRADKLPPYNPKTRVEMPALTEVAKRGIPFWGYSQGNESRASHGSIWTSNYVINHKMYVEGMHLKQSLTSIPKALKPSGYHLACVTANGYVSKHWGFGEHWNKFSSNIHDGGGIMANDLARHAIEYIEKQGDKPWMFFMGTIEGHVSWRGRQPWLDKYDTTPYKGPFEKWCSGQALESIIAGRMKITERDKVRIRALYDSALSYGDHHFGTVVAKLKEKGLYDDTMFIINADHGDEFWEKGRVGHGGSIRQTMVQVPMIVSYPPLFPAGRLEDENVDAVDLLPTMADAIGVPIPSDAQGESLIPVAQGALAGYPRPSFTSQYEIAWAMRLGRYKLMIAGGKASLFDVVADPSEDSDLWTSRPIERRHVADAMAFMLLYQSKWKKTRHGVASNQRAEFAQDLESGALQALRPGAGAKAEGGAEAAPAAKGPKAAKAAKAKPPKKRKR
jgi:arylsulfatase A-like enzyme